MHEYEIFFEDINPCGGEQYSKKTLIDVINNRFTDFLLWLFKCNSQFHIKMIYQRKQKRLAQGKKCTATDARYFQIAENLLYMELGVMS